MELHGKNTTMKFISSEALKSKIVGKTDAGVNVSPTNKSPAKQPEQVPTTLTDFPMPKMRQSENFASIANDDAPLQGKTS